jgi:DNA-directed RNA polymerase specialized sigma24 family protein
MRGRGLRHDAPAGPAPEFGLYLEAMPRRPCPGRRGGYVGVVGGYQPTTPRPSLESARCISARPPTVSRLPAAAVRHQALLAVQAAARHKHQFLTRAISLNHEYGGDTTSSGEPWASALLDALPAISTRSDPETRLLVNEQLSTVVHALPSLTERERRALAGTLDGRSYAQVGPIIGGSTKAASHEVDRARRKLAAALRQAA